MQALDQRGFREGAHDFTAPERRPGQIRRQYRVGRFRRSAGRHKGVLQLRLRHLLPSMQGAYRQACPGREQGTLPAD